MNNVVDFQPLLNCPICKSGCVVEEDPDMLYSGNTLYRVRCTECGLTSRLFGHKDAAIEYWNKRKNNTKFEVYTDQKIFSLPGLNGEDSIMDVAMDFPSGYKCQKCGTKIPIESMHYLIVTDGINILYCPSCGSPIENYKDWRFKED